MLIVSNHTSWLDIPVLSAVAPVSFIAKKEVAGWPFVSWLAKLQRSVFVDRQRRGAVGETTSEIIRRLQSGDTVVLFAEGTSSDGNRVLPFKTALFAAAKPSAKAAEDAPDAVVQTLSLVYTRLHGVPFGRADRPLVGWYGDMEMQSHAWQLLKAGPLDVRIRIGPPVPLDSFADRKELGQEKRGAGSRACRPYLAGAAGGRARRRQRSIGGAAQGHSPRRRRAASGSNAIRKSSSGAPAGQTRGSMLQCSNEDVVTAVVG